MARPPSPAALEALLKARVRTVRDWPKPGVNFRDVTPLFQDPAAFRLIVEAFARDCARRKIDVIAAVDARGFIAGGALAYQLGLPFALVRKKGKLPFRTLAEDYALEYGTAAIEVHADACRPGDRVLITDDLVATGGTLLAAAKLFRALGGKVAGVSAIIDLPGLGGSRKLRADGCEVHALCTFDEQE
jgi:adenine phosphoribosyltransferase